MSSFPQALSLPRYMTDAASSATAVSKSNPKIEWLLTMVKGATRPSDEEIAQRKARGEEMSVVWEGVGVYSTRGKAEAVIAWKCRQIGAHDRDAYQIAPFIEDDVLPHERFHLEDDDDSPPSSEYVVVEKAQLEELIRVMRDG